VAQFVSELACIKPIYKTGEIMLRFKNSIFALLLLFTLLLSACQPIRPDTSTIKATALREITEIERGGNLALVDELFADDFDLHFSGYPTMDREG
jgi:hypothetical protein